MSSNQWITLHLKEKETIINLGKDFAEFVVGHARQGTSIDQDRLFDWADEFAEILQASLNQIY